MSDLLKKVYNTYFKIKLMDQKQACAPHRICKRCKEDLHSSYRGQKISFRVGILMIWREQHNHIDDCYFCSFDVKGFNLHNKKEINYSNINSAIYLVLYSSDILVTLINWSNHIWTTFLKNLVAYNVEQGERFHQDLNIMRKRYHERLDVNITLDYFSDP